MIIFLGGGGGEGRGAKPPLRSNPILDFFFFGETLFCYGSIHAKTVIRELFQANVHSPFIFIVSVDNLKDILPIT